MNQETVEPTTTSIRTTKEKENPIDITTKYFIKLSTNKQHVQFIEKFVKVSKK